MINLPKICIVDKFIPKKTFYEKVNIASNVKNEFIDLIDKIVWKYKLSEDTIKINKTKEVEEIEIFEITLKERKIPKSVINIIIKAIPYKILFVLKYKEDSCYAMNAEQTYFSKWNEDIKFDFTGINLESIYQNIVKKIINEESNNSTFSDIIKNKQLKEQLLKKMDILKNKIRQEKQFNKKVELNQELRRLEKELGDLINE